MRKCSGNTDRIVGFKHWRATAYGAQAIALLDALGDTLDETILRHRLAQEDAVDALEALRAIARDLRGTPVTHAALRAILERLPSPERAAQ